MASQVQLQAWLLETNNNSGTKVTKGNN
jgi:hypothetical protein